MLHYSSRSFQLDLNKLSITSKEEPIEILRPRTISDIDIHEIQMLYRCIPDQQVRDTLHAREILIENDELTSQNGIYRAVLQANGNFVIFVSCLNFQIQLRNRFNRFELIGTK